MGSSSKLQRRWTRASSIAAVLKWEVFKVARVEFTTSSGGLQHVELFIGEIFLRSLCYCITIDCYSTISLTQPDLQRKASVLTTCLRNACIAMKARF